MEGMGYKDIIEKAEIYQITDAWPFNRLGIIEQIGVRHDDCIVEDQKAWIGNHHKTFGYWSLDLFFGTFPHMLLGPIAFTGPELEASWAPWPKLLDIEVGIEEVAVDVDRARPWFAIQRLPGYWLEYVVEDIVINPHVA